MSNSKQPSEQNPAVVDSAKDNAAKFQEMGASLAAASIRRPVTTLMLFFSLLILGLVSSRLLPLEKWPGIDIPEMWIHIPYKDATPAEVEKMVTRPIEEALATISGIQRMQSSSSEEGSDIGLEFKWDENLKAKSIEAREKIDAIRHLLPRDVERVLVYQFNTNDIPIFNLRISSERDLSNAFDLLERNLQRPIERVPGVSRVTLYGVNKKQISIRLNAERVAALHVDSTELLQNLREMNFSMTAGHFYTDDSKVIVNPQGEFKTLDDVKNVRVTPNVRLSDIADIRYETPRREEGRHLDRSFAIGLDIFKESSANLVEVSQRISKVLKEAEENPQFDGISLLVQHDEAESVTTSLKDLLDAGLLGALLSVIVLYIYLRNISITLLVVLSVPFSICITLGFMYLMGYSLNILSMMGLMLAVGMLVDNAVVITESIYQEREKVSISLAETIKATKLGVSKVSLAVITGTATTAIVFLPNIVGKKIDVTVFLEHVAIAICISLFASLAIAQTLIPLLSTKLKSETKAKTVKPSKIKNFYKRTLGWSLRSVGKTSVIAVLILASTAIPLGVVTSDEEGNEDQRRIWLNYDIQGSYSLEEVEKVVDRMEEFLYSNKDKYHIDTVYSYFRSGYAVSRLQMKADLPIKVSEVKKMINEDMPSFVRAKPSFRWDSGNGGGIRLNLLGQSSDVLLKLAENIVPILNNIEGLEDVKVDLEGNKQELQVKIDRNAAYRFDMNTEEIANIIATALRGSNLRTFRASGNGEIDVRLMFDEELQDSIKMLKAIPIKQNGNQVVTLDMVANVEVKERLGEVSRYYRQTAIAIGANLSENADGEKLTLGQAQKKIESVMQHISLPSGYKWSLDGSFRRQNEAESVMQQNMLLAVAMIYIVMAALFESLLLPTAVITSLIFAITGVFWALMVTGTSMSIMAMIGILILMGIVVNNGIVLVDQINQLINSGMERKAAVMGACMSRVRPIMMTVSTTVLGLIPLALGSATIGGDGPPYSPMAIAIIGGLIFSTVTSLYLVPHTYLLLLTLKEKTSAMINDSKKVSSKVLNLTMVRKKES